MLISESAWEEMTCLFAPSLEKKGKFIAREEGFTTAENKICRH
ncbi:hypothetical protein [Klebsiella pneumoniae]